MSSRFTRLPRNAACGSVVKGEVTINGTKATTSDGLAIWDEQAISVHADSDSEILLFDLPPVLIVI